MRRGNFFRRNQYKIAAICVAAAVLGVVAAYMYSGMETGQEPKQQVAVKETEVIEKKEPVQQAKKEDKEEEKKKEKEKEKTKKTSAVIAPKKEETDTEDKTDTAKEEGVKGQEENETVETASIQKPAATELHFDAQAGLLWPVNGAVILDYSMDQTVYFATLDQYKYNPAVIISGNVNDQVKAAANGKITDISTNEETGCTVTMDLGDGYTAIYGQLKEVPYEVGAYLEAGNNIGFISEPTKYYSLEGSNLYFAMEKDGAPVDPVEYFQ